ncbi:MAG: hypothetical protein WAM18_13095, partial [Halobacillus sp.]|uniref:hypothetical protein n=1 Tax=Halobacillus sp. TaxID=56800 RepID=UPI003BAF97F6
ARGSSAHAREKRNRPPQDQILTKVSKLSLHETGALVEEYRDDIRGVNVLKVTKRILYIVEHF